ncbi:MAG: GxxExxY protein [Rhodospirillales bacterium]
MSETVYREAELTGKILGAAFEVSNHLGAGFLERVYHNALLLELQQRRIDTRSEVPLVVSYKGQSVGQYYADIIVAGRVIVEIKAIDTLTRSHVGQVLNYLRATGLGVGLLMNFGCPRLQYQRVVI